MGAKYRFLHQHIKQYRGAIWNIIFASLLVTVIGINWPYLYKIIVNEVFILHSYQMALFVILIYIAMFGVEKFLQYLWRCSDAVLATDFLDSIRSEVYRHFFAMKERDRVRYSVGEIADIIENDTFSVYQFLTMDGIHTVTSGVRFVLSIFYVWYMNHELGGLICVMIPLVYLSGIYLDKKMKPIAKRIQENNNAIYAWIFDLLYGIRTIKLLQAMDYFEKQIMERAEKAVFLEGHKAEAENQLNQARSLISLLCDLGIYSMSAWYIYHGKMSVGDFVAIMVYYNWARQFFERMGNFFLHKSTHFVALDRLARFLESETEDSGKERYQGGDIVFEGVSFGYQDRTILDRFHIVIKEKQWIAITGKSGCGKTTITSLLCRFYDPTEGCIKIGDLQIQDISLDDLRKNISILRQNSAVFMKPIRFNLTLGNQTFSDDEIWAVLRLVELDHDVAELENGLDGMLGSQKRLSQGQEQRLALARALLLSKNILILDEATSNIDYAMEKRILNRIRQKYPYLTILMVTYREVTAEQADTVFYLNGNEVIQGTHRALYETNEEYRRLLSGG